MAVDLSDLVEVLKRETSPPGTDLFPDATDDEWLGYLQDAFWEAKWMGMPFDSWSEAEGIIAPTTSGGDDISREYQQVIVFVAGYRIVRSKLLNTNTTFRAKAGPVEYETQQSATLLRDVLADLKYKLTLIINRISDLGYSATYYIDSLAARDESVNWGDSYYVTG